MMKRLSLKLLYLRVLFIFKKAFLPSGYPYSVSEDYLEYQLWDSVQAFASSIMNNLATAAIFKGVGVGDGNATVLAATVTWLLKDGTSIVGSLVFATVQCTKMDSYCKRWRLFADILNDCAICVDLLSPSLPSGLYFTLVQCFSGVLRSLVGIAGGATRAALTQHQAMNNNLADVSAKDNSQERMVNLAALGFSLIIIPLISEKPVFIWTLFVFFTISHIYANFRAVSCVRLDVFNANRLAIFYESFTAKLEQDSSSNLEDKNKLSFPLSVAEVNGQENVWLWNTDPRDGRFSNLTLRYADQQPVNMMAAAGRDTSEAMEAYLFDDQEGRYLLTMSPQCANGTFKLTAYLFVDLDQLRSCSFPETPTNTTATSTFLTQQELIRLQISLLYVVFLLKFCYEEKVTEKLPKELKEIGRLLKQAKDTDSGVNHKSRQQAMQKALVFAKKVDDNLMRQVEVSGWRTSHLLLSELFVDDEPMEKIKREEEHLEGKVKEH